MLGTAEVSGRGGCCAIGCGLPWPGTESPFVLTPLVPFEDCTGGRCGLLLFLLGLTSGSAGLGRRINGGSEPLGVRPGV